MRRLIYLALALALATANAVVPFATRTYQTWQPAGNASMTFTSTTSQHALPAAGSVAFICNTNASITAYINLGTSSAVTASTTTSFAVPPTYCVRLEATGFTNWAGITTSGSALVTVSVGAGSP